MADQQLPLRRSTRIAERILSPPPPPAPTPAPAPRAPTVPRDVKIQMLRTILQDPSFLSLSDRKKIGKVLHTRMKPHKLVGYSFEFDIWREYIMKKIETKETEGILFYLDYVLENIYGKYVENMDFMLEILDKMRDRKLDLLFWERPFFTKLKAYSYENTTWWKEHVLHSLLDDSYMYKLTHSNWKYMSENVLQNIYVCTERGIDNIIYGIYTKDELKEYRFKGDKKDQDMFLQVYDNNLPKIQQDKVRYYLESLIIKRSQVSPPLTIDIDTSATVSLNWYPYKTDGLYKFMLLCMEKNDNSIIKKLVKSFDMKREENKEWFNLQLQYIIRPSYIKTYGHKINIEESKKIVSFILTNYKMNINNVYMRMRELFSGNVQIRDPIANPKLWLNKNVPPIAWAVIYNNLDAVHFFMRQGAKLDRCALSMQDLTTNPKILGLFNLETKVKKIQQAYKNLYYEPLPEEGTIDEAKLDDHQIRRLTGIQRRTIAREAAFKQYQDEEISSSQTGGKKTTKIRSNTNKDKMQDKKNTKN